MGAGQAQGLKQTHALIQVVWAQKNRRKAMWEWRGGGAGAWLLGWEGQPSQGA